VGLFRQSISTVGKRMIKRLLPRAIKTNPYFIRVKEWVYRWWRHNRKRRRPGAGKYGHTGPMYWENRKNLQYYQTVVELARKYAPGATQAIDIGSNITQVIHRLTWIPRRIALDIEEIPPASDVEAIRADFLKYDPGTIFDLVLCLQVLEHLEDPEPFAQKLLRTGRTLILALPYRWPHGLVGSHIQDPVDEDKLFSWTHTQPVETAMITDRRRQRLVAVYQSESQ
jgi:SAM-dependent methyltransferase